MAEAKRYDYGLGRRKSATATARLVKGKGAIVINGKPAAEYLSDNKSMLGIYLTFTYIILEVCCINRINL